MTAQPQPRARTRAYAPSNIAGRLSRRPRLESAIQADIVGYLRAVLMPAEAFVYANANAARRTDHGSAGNAVPGLYPGIPDLAIVATDGRAFYLEVKNEVGKPSPAQEGVFERFDGMRVPHAIVRGIDDVRAALARWGIATREVQP